MIELLITQTCLAAQMNFLNSLYLVKIKEKIEIREKSMQILLNPFLN